MFGEKPMEWRDFVSCIAIPLAVTAAIAIAVTAAFRKRKREAEEQRRIIDKARENILADGRVDGPPGPYVPHHKWKDAGTPHATDGETKPPRKGGYCQTKGLE
jgi:hypothetical protein